MAQSRVAVFGGRKAYRGRPVHAGVGKFILTDDDLYASQI